MSAGSQDVHFKPEPSHELLRQATLDVYRPDTKEILKIENSDLAISQLCLHLEKKDTANHGRDGRLGRLRVVAT